MPNLMRKKMFGLTLKKTRINFKCQIFMYDTLMGNVKCLGKLSKMLPCIGLILREMREP